MLRPPIPNPPYSDDCLCGAARNLLNPKPLTQPPSQCDTCKKMSGGTNILVMTVPRDSFEHLSGELLRFRRTADSGNQSDVVHCAVSGTRMWHEPQSVPVATIAIG